MALVFMELKKSIQQKKDLFNLRKTKSTRIFYTKSGANIHKL
jgi:hypothetical protein